MATQPMPEIQEQMRLVQETGWFDPEWYRQQYRDVQRRRMDPLQHYVTLGGRVLYRPSERFDLDGYLKKFPELRHNRVPALLHLALNGNQAASVVQNIHPVTKYSISEKALYDLKIDQHRFQIPLGPVEGSITAIIPTCGKSKLLDQCMDSLDDETKVILVANGDHKKEIAQKYEGRRNVEVLVMQGSFNWSVANNLGARKASTEYLLFLNDDLYGGLKGWERALLRAFYDTKVRVVGPIITNPDGSIQSAGCYRVPRGCTSAHIQFRPFHSRYVESVMGAALMVKKGVFDAAQGFDPDYRLLMAETDFCMRVGLCAVVHDVFVTHDERTSRGNQDPVEDIQRFIGKYPVPVGQEWWGRFIVPKRKLRVLAMKLDHIGDAAIAEQAVKEWAQGKEVDVGWLVNPVAKDYFEGLGYETYAYSFFHENASMGQLKFDEKNWREFVKDMLPDYDLVVDLRAHGESAHLLKAWKDTGALTFSFGEQFHTYQTFNNKAQFHNKQALGAFLGALPILSMIVDESRGNKIVVCLASSSIVKTWPTDHWEALCKLLRSAGHEVVQLLAPGSDKLQNVDDRVEVKLSMLREWAQREAWLYIGHDTGPTHIVSLAGVPVMEIVGGLVAPNEWQGLGALVSLTMGVPCAPCYRQPCKMGNLACIKTIAPQQVFELVKRLEKLGV